LTVSVKIQTRTSKLDCKNPKPKTSKNIERTKSEGPHENLRATTAKRKKARMIDKGNAIP
jgi:hypothetical protein